ncbi:hypothetical protein [Pseudorhodoferax sp. Leaf265]|uniref:hypothetical protein n=1 Tax=Pseudorhodoferax sp. Leaf265 TaxID=1736315 RepID=UPI0006FFA5D1|nr:hypothetical protein [Pseudorhodoferax sp. Leaf265]KQP02442.1 hypothetical protein ASF45_20525 [Pseudorhodoferax sp. Leaf265]
MRLALKKTARPTLFGPVSHVIGKRLDHGPYSHVELILPNGLSASAVMGEGVRIKAITYSGGSEAWDFYELPGALGARAHRWFTDHDGEGYDYGAMVRFWWGVVAEERGRWTCCEAVGAALGWSRPWPYSPSGLLARAVDHYAARKVAGPWPDDMERMSPALRHLIGSGQAALSDWGRL